MGSASATGRAGLQHRAPGGVARGLAGYRRGHVGGSSVRVRHDGDRHGGETDSARRYADHHRRRAGIHFAGADQRGQSLARPGPGVVGEVPGLYMTMIETAELVAERYKISREAQDEYALRSQQRTAAGQQAGAFDDEIVAMPSVMLATDRNTGETSKKIRQPGQGRGQPSGDEPGGPGVVEAGVQGWSDRQRGKIHYGRQCLAIIRWRVGGGVDGGGGSVSPRTASVGDLPRHGGGGLRAG